MRSLVSIVIPCYNTERYLGAALESVLAQGYEPLQVIVIDDGSTDGSAAIARRDARVEYIHQKNRGVCAARNHGLSVARGEFVVFFDADDVMLPGCIETGVRELSARPECGFVYGFARFVDAMGRPLHPGATPARVEGASYETLLSGHGLVPPGVAMFRREAVMEAGGFDAAVYLAEDHDLYLRVARKRGVYCHNEYVADYRWHGDNACGRSPATTFRGALDTIDRQREYIRGDRAREAAAAQGRRHWASIFGPQLPGEVIVNIKRGNLAKAMNAMGMLVRHYPKGVAEFAASRAKRVLGRS